MNALPFSLLLLLAASLASSAAGQGIGGENHQHLRLDGSIPSGLYGWDVERVGDVNADGFADLLVSADKSAVTDFGVIEVYSGFDGALLHHIDLDVTTERVVWYRHAMDGAGDVDGDGHADFLFGANRAAPNGILGAGSVFLHSGATGALLRRWDGTTVGEGLGSSVSNVGDINGDGIDDHSMASLGHYVDIRSGADGALLLNLPAVSPHNNVFGHDVIGIGDVNGDGIGDLVVSDFLANLPGRFQAGEVAVFSGADGSLLANIPAPPSCGFFGNELATLGDIDGDGLGDFAVAVQDPGIGSKRGAVFLYSGGTGALLRQILGAEGDAIRLVAAIGDVDGDGVTDLLLGGSNGDHPNGTRRVGVAAVHSGRTGVRLWAFRGQGFEDGFGVSVAGPGDMDGDGMPDIAFSGYVGSQHSGIGAVFVHAGFNPYIAQDVAELSIGSGSAQITVDFPVSEAGQAYLTLLSGREGLRTIRGFDIPLGETPVLELMIGGMVPQELVNGDGFLDAAGDATVTLNASAVMTPLVGRQLFLAVVTYDTALHAGRLSTVPVAFDIVP